MMKETKAHLEIIEYSLKLCADKLINIKEFDKELTSDISIELELLKKEITRLIFIIKDVTQEVA